MAFNGRVSRIEVRVDLLSPIGRKRLLQTSFYFKWIGNYTVMHYLVAEMIYF